MIASVYALLSYPSSSYAENLSADEDDVILSREQVLWLWASETGDEAPLFKAGLKEALAAEGPRHILGSHAFRAHLGQRSSTLPNCVIGLEPCVSAHALAFESLNLALVVRLFWELGEDSVFKVRYAVLDRRGEWVREGEQRGEHPREVAFDLVREIFDATGNVAFETSPAGAQVILDGEVLGTSPIDQRLAVGAYDYRLILPNYRPVDGRLEIGSAASVVLRHDLALLPGTFRVAGAPEGATLYVNEVPRGRANEAIELEPGNYTFEVRADGYETFRDTARITPGAEVEVEALLEGSPGFLGKVPREAILTRRFGLRLGYETSLHVTTFRNARHSVEGREYEFRGFSEDGVIPDDDVLRNFVSPHGVRLEAYYTGEYFGLTLLSLSWLTTSLSLPGEVEVRQTRESIPVEVVGLRRLQLRPVQLTLRYFYENLVPQVEAGTGIGFQWLHVEGAGVGPADSIRLRQTEAFWSLGAGLQYFVTPQYSVMLRYGLQGFFNQGLGLEHTLGLSVGMGFQNFFGVDAEPPGTL